jgi:hypothetical protein
MPAQAVEAGELAFASPLAQGVRAHAQALSHELQVEELGEVCHNSGLQSTISASLHASSHALL